MKIKLLLGVLLFLSNATYSQEIDSRLSEKYAKYSFTAYDILSSAHFSGFKPSLKGAFNGSFDYFEKVFLSFTKQDSKALTQMKITACYQCSIIKNSTYLMNRYNSKYKPVDMETWFNNCPYLFIVMDIDNSLN